jgi:hypothetical protein
MNVIEKFNEGQRGTNKGLSMGEGLKAISLAINGIQKSRVYTVAAGPKVGKSTLVDVGFVIEPCLDSMQNNIPFELIYLSYEIDRVSKEFDFIAHFIARDYGIIDVPLAEGSTYKGLKTVPLEAGYLMGQVQDDNGVIIKVSPEIFTMIKTVYKDRIIPLFGEYGADGSQIKPGIITFIDTRENPTGIRNKLIAHAKTEGTFVYENSIGSGGKQFQRMIGYKPNNPAKTTLIITDHLRKLILERGFTLKQTIDKFAEYSTELRNTCGYSFVHIIHLNRNMADIKRMQYADDRLFPTADDIKETGNLSEESNYIFTMFNPNDDKYNLKKHFGLMLKDVKNNLLHPDIRTVHLVESRHCSYPQHFRVNMLGATKQFKQLTI